MKNIILTGFMGSGKSTIGGYIEQKTAMPFIDTDKFIEENHSMTIREIFEKYGESYFREMETSAIKQLCETDNQIIATGGGIVTREENIQIMKRNGIIVFIDVPYDSICQRLAEDTTRPLINSEEKLKNMSNLLNARMPLYIGSADIIVKGDNSALIADEILSKITFF